MLRLTTWCYVFQTFRIEVEVDPKFDTSTKLQSIVQCTKVNVLLCSSKNKCWERIVPCELVNAVIQIRIRKNKKSIRKSSIFAKIRFEKRDVLIRTL